MSNVIRMPALGWCVRAGIASRAHFLTRSGGLVRSLCGTVMRPDLYVRQRLAPRQSRKPRCLSCLHALAMLQGHGHMHGGGDGAA